MRSTRSVRLVLLIGIVATVALPARAQVKLGIDVLREEGFAILKGKRVGLVAHPASVDSSLTHTVDVLRNAPQVKLVALFAAEHGVWGDEYGGDKIADQVDPRTKLPVYSLYGPTRKPTPQMLEQIDVLVFDMQDIGSRSYTFISTMKVCLEACAENAVEFVVLDRPNPLGGERIEGPPLAKEFESFIGMLYVPYVHGMTMGELAQHVRDEVAPGYRKLRVVKMRGWTRDMVWQDTGLAWVPTSPHIPQPSTCAAYAATGILGELHAVSIGVGYTLPFEIVGAPDLSADELAEKMNRAFASSMRDVPRDGGTPPLHFRPARFKPFYQTFAGQPSQGVQVHIDPKRSPTLVEINYRLIEALGGAKVFQGTEKRHGSFDKASGSDVPRKWIVEGKDLDKMFAQWRQQCETFRRERAKWLLY